MADINNLLNQLPPKDGKLSNETIRSCNKCHMG